MRSQDDPRTPHTLVVGVCQDSFIDLKHFNVFAEGELKELASTAGFRNRLAHDYLDLDEQIALRSMKKILSIYPDYIQKIKNLWKT